MPKNISKIYQRTSFILLAIMISGLFNICLFVLRANAVELMQTPKFNFIYDNSGDCIVEPMPEPTQTINRPTAPMPECCLAQNRNYNAVINTANDKSAPTFLNPIILPLDTLNFENNSTQYTSRLIYHPPGALALASIVIRE